MNRKEKRLLAAAGLFAALTLICFTLAVTLAWGIKSLFPSRDNQAVSLALTGDFLWEQGLYDWMDDYQFGTYFDQVLPYLQADLTIANHEVPIGGQALGVSGIEFTFNAPEQIAQQLPDIGVNVVTLANNHSLDMGLEGLNNTLDNLDAAGIQHTGAYRNAEEADQLTILEAKGVKIALLSYTYDTNEPRLNEDNVSYFLSSSLEFTEDYRNKLTNQITRAKEAADLVFVAMHWGTEFTYELNKAQEVVADFLTEQGVDLVIGNHSHNVQAAEIRKNQDDHETLIFYSLGNTVSSDVNVSRATPDFQNLYHVGALVNLDIVKQKDGYQFDNIQIIPIVNHFETNYSNFQLIPLKEYDQSLASKHYQAQYNDDFNLEWIKEQVLSTFEPSGLSVLN